MHKFRLKLFFFSSLLAASVFRWHLLKDGSSAKIDVGEGVGYVRPEYRIFYEFLSFKCWNVEQYERIQSIYCFNRNHNLPQSKTVSHAIFWKEKFRIFTISSANVAVGAFAKLYRKKIRLDGQIYETWRCRVGIMESIKEIIFVPRLSWKDTTNIKKKTTTKSISHRFRTSIDASEKLCLRLLPYLPRHSLFILFGWMAVHVNSVSK